jgi:hypothetical protein
VHGAFMGNKSFSFVQTHSEVPDSISSHLIRSFHKSFHGWVRRCDVYYPGIGVPPETMTRKDRFDTRNNESRMLE